MLEEKTDNYTVFNGGILVFIIHFNETVSAQAVNLLHSISYIANLKEKVCAVTGSTLISYKVEN